MRVKCSSHAVVVASYALLVGVGVTGCSQLNKVFDNNEVVNYKNAGAVASLEVPPDLTTPKYDSTFSVNTVNNTVAASAIGSSATGNSNGTNVLPESASVQLKNSASERWLEVAVSAGVLWNKVEGFWTTIGVELKRNEPTVGVMETDWIQTRGHLPQGVIQRALGSILKNATDSGIRDRYTVRFEKVTAGLTRIYMSHRGAEQVVSDTGNKWEMRPGRAAAEAEMLNRLKAYLQGANPGDVAGSANESASDGSAGLATLSDANGQMSLNVQDSYDRAWLRTGSILTNVGFSLDGQNKSKGLYAARWEVSDKKKKGFFARLIKPNEKFLDNGAEQLIHVSPSGSGSVLKVLDKYGKPVNVTVARKILERLKTEFNR
jgi:outer membrane protein assembly factor BamC